MTRSFAITIILASLFAFSGARGQRPADDAISAAVYYADQALVLSTKHGTAVVKFTSTKDGDKLGAHYHYRFVSAEGKETSGEGDVYENYKRPNQQPAAGPIVDLGSKTVVEAGETKLRWSRGSDQSGWIYYVPEEMTVQIANTDSFEKLELRRFKK